MKKKNSLTLVIFYKTPLSSTRRPPLHAAHTVVVAAHIAHPRQPLPITQTAPFNWVQGSGPLPIVTI